MTDPDAAGRTGDIDARLAGDITGGPEGGCAGDSGPESGAQHASADVAPELFGW